MALHSNDFRSGLLVGDYSYESALPEDQLTTDAQRERRSRILDAAVAVAGGGGYDSVHMRDIATHARVSLATLYHYFPSKVHVLACALDRELMRFDDHLSADLFTSVDPFVRLTAAVSRLIDAMEASEAVTEAMAHAYAAANLVALAEAEMIRAQTSDMFVHLLGDNNTPVLYRRIADTLTDVWTSEMLAMVQGRRTYADIGQRLRTVIELMARRVR